MTVPPSPGPFWVVGQALLLAGRHWPLALALYVPGALLGLATALPVLAAAGSLAPLGPWLARVLDGDAPSLLLELAGTAGGSQPSNEALAALQATGLWLGVAVMLLALALPIQGLLYTLLAGGVLAALASRPPEGQLHAPALSSAATSITGDSSPELLTETPPTGFWQECQHWAWPMLRLSLLGFVAFVVLGAIGSGAIGLALQGVGIEATTLMALVWLGLLNGALELARADLVVGETRSVSRVLGRALAVLFTPRRLAAALPLWLGLTLAGSAQLGLAIAVLGALPLDWVLPSLVLQQLAFLLGAWLKLARLAGAVALAQSSNQASSRHPNPTAPLHP